MGMSLSLFTGRRCESQFYQLVGSDAMSRQGFLNVRVYEQQSSMKCKKEICLVQNNSVGSNFQSLKPRLDVGFPCDCH